MVSSSRRVNPTKSLARMLMCCSVGGSSFVPKNSEGKREAVLRSPSVFITIIIAEPLKCSSLDEASEHWMIHEEKGLGNVDGLIAPYLR